MRIVYIQPSSSLDAVARSKVALVENTNQPLEVCGLDERHLWIDIDYGLPDMISYCIKNHLYLIAKPYPCELCTLDVKYCDLF